MSFFDPSSWDDPFVDLYDKGKSVVDKATDIARAMVARYGMDEDLGHVSYDTDRPGFLGTGDQSSWLNRRYSEATAERMDQKVAWVKEGAGDRFDDLEINAWVAVASLTAVDERVVVVEYCG